MGCLYRNHVHPVPLRLFIHPSPRNSLLPLLFYIRPLVAGTSEADQLDRIFRLLGTPSPQDFPGIVELPEYRADLPRYPPPRGGLTSPVPTLDPTGIDLLDKMLQYDPARRVTAQDALDHPFFYDMTGRA